MAIKRGWLRAQDEAESTMVFSNKEKQDWKRHRLLVNLTRYFISFLIPEYLETKYGICLIYVLLLRVWRHEKNVIEKFRNPWNRGRNIPLSTKNSRNDFNMQLAKYI